MSDLLMRITVWLAATPLGSPDALNLPAVSFEDGLSRALSTVFTLIGAISVVFIVVGAVKYTVSGGDPAGTRSAKDTILYAVIGLVISLLAFGVVTFVTSNVG